MTRADACNELVPEGALVIFNRPQNGWPGDSEAAIKAGLFVGRVYRVDAVEDWGSITYLGLDGFAARFNSVLFTEFPD